MQKNFIVRGTTPTFSFTLPFHTEEVAGFYLTARQAERKDPVLDKGTDECDLSDYTARFTLSQSDTLRLRAGAAALQARIRLKDGTLYASPVFNLGVRDILKEELI